MIVSIVDADLENETHQNAIVDLLDRYALDLQGYSRKLPQSVLNELIPEIKKMPTSLIFLAQHEGEFIGMAICFLGFSTFYARPIINIHDFTVKKEYRKNGVGSRLVKAIEAKAAELGCCKLTLEVQERNVSALRMYEKSGFEGSVLDESAGQALFMTKFLMDKQ